MMICAEAEDAPTAFDLVGTMVPDIAVIDISLKNESGLELVKNLDSQFPLVALIVLSMHDEALYAGRALRAGARGYVMKRETTKSVLSAIRRVLEGSVCVSEICESHPSTPECPAAVKSSTHEPMVTAKTMMAAVALLSETAAANKAIDPISNP